MRRMAHDKGRGAKTPADTYPAIRAALEFLGDHHSSLFEPSPKKASAPGAGRILNCGIYVASGYVARLMPTGPAAQAGLRVGMHLLKVDNNDHPTGADFYTTADQLTVVAQEGANPAETFAVTPGGGRESYEPSGRIIDGKYGYIDIPHFSGNSAMGKQFTDRAQELIRTFDTSKLKGWIIDLRLNGGGNLWPMIAGLGPLYPAGKLGSFVSADGTVDWVYENGQAGTKNNKMATATAPYSLQAAGRPIAVLVSENTGSSGEAMLITFRGIPNVRSFGRPTYGVPTANNYFPLSDGATINLTVALDADRTGKEYDTKISPDVAIKSDWSKLGRDDDPDVRAAIRWLAK